MQRQLRYMHGLLSVDDVEELGRPRRRIDFPSPCGLAKFSLEILPGTSNFENVREFPLTGMQIQSESLSPYGLSKFSLEILPGTSN